MTKIKLLRNAFIIAAALALLTACGRKEKTTVKNETEPISESTGVTEEPTGEGVEIVIGENVNNDAKEFEDKVMSTDIEITGYTEYNDTESYFLSQGDKVAVITPSSMANSDQVNSTVTGLKQWGFEPVLGKYVSVGLRTLEECIEDFEWALNDPEIKAIFCVRGGYGGSDVLDTIPADLIASAKKPIIGYSDITAYHSAWSVAGLPSIHACMSETFVSLPKACADAELNMMKGMIPSYRCKSNKYCKAGSAEGVLIGGNMSTVLATLNTAYDCTKIDEHYIIFLEEVGENIQHLHRYLTILKHAGVLDNADGIIFGEWTNCDMASGNFGDQRGGYFESVEDMIDSQILSDIDIPVAFGFPAGHEKTNYPLLMGANVKLNVGNNSYTVSWGE